MAARHPTQRWRAYQEARRAQSTGVVKQTEVPGAAGPAGLHLKATRQVCEALGVGPLQAMEFLAALDRASLAEEPRTLHAA